MRRVGRRTRSLDSVEIYLGVAWVVLIRLILSVGGKTCRKLDGLA